MAEVAEISRKQSRVVGQRNGRHLQIRRPDAEARLFQALKFGGGRFIKLQHGDLR